ncbi:MAG: hypothetical protein ACFE8U_05755 [Candidatus Hermodarchaeota archaeon]
MPQNEDSSDILVIHQNRIIFSSGEGLLTQHSKISAQVTQVLTLFSQRIMGGELIHFIRFANHRMIFLFSQTKKEDLVTIVLIPIERSARQVIPAMNIILRQVEKFLQGDILDAKNRHLDTFYQILSAPDKSFVVVPRTPEGILCALVILTAFAHDLQFGIERVVSNVHFIDPNNTQEFERINQLSKNRKVLSFVPIPNMDENDNILSFGLEAPLRQYFSAFPGEKTYDVIGRVFGDQSNAAKMRRFIANEEAYEIAQSVSLLPYTEDDFIRNEVLMTTVINPGKDVIVTMTTPVMQKLRELSSSVPVEKVPIGNAELEGLSIKLQEETIEDKTPIAPYSVSELDTTIDLAAEPDTVPETAQDLTIKPIEPTVQTTVSQDVLARLNETRRSGFEYRFDSIPLVLDTAPFEIKLSESLKLPFDETEITISLFSVNDRHFSIHIYTFLDRLPALKDSLEDLSIRIGGESYLRENHVSIEGPIEKQRETLRSLLWLCIVEYLTQVVMKFKKLSNRFEIPKEGSILIIPPNRDFIREKIPSKFKDFVEEIEIRQKIEQDAIWTLGRAQDDLLSSIMTPLKQGGGVVFVASENNKEMEEIALFLLLISEVCGIGFSRW